MFGRAIVGIAALGLMASAALAFQETKGGAVTEQQPAQSEPSGKVLDLGTPTPQPGKSTGPEIRIPGLGTLGVLPKFDFGLELLYGVNEDKRPEVEKGSQEPDDGMQIRGTLKHRF